MTDTSYQIIKTFFLECKKDVEEVTFFFHPDNDDGAIDISYNDNDDFETDLYLPELAALMAERNLDTYDEEKYHWFKSHIASILETLNKENVFTKKNLFVYSQHIDGAKEVILRIDIKKINLFPPSQHYSFDLSMVHQERERKWWKVVTPTWQEDRPFQNLELTPNTREDINFYSWIGESLCHINIKNLTLISDRKIKKLWDYESSDLYEIFSDRFCQMLSQIGVKNIEYYPVTVTCKATEETSSSYYKLANIVGLVEGIYFYDKSDFEKGIDTIIKSKRVWKKVNSIMKAKKEILYCIEEKIVRCKDCRQLFIVDNDIKEACEINKITGIEFEDIILIN